MNCLKRAVPEFEKRKNKRHQVFEISFEAKIIESEKFLFQKLHYIHHNPVSKKWNLVEDFRDYPYSSAGFYEKVNYDGYKITSYDEIYND